MRAANKCTARAAIADLTWEGWGIHKRRGFQRSTILDVARSADVSSTTVSHVLNGTRFVAEATGQALTAADRPSALVALNTPLAVGALLACRDLGLDVPRDVSLAVLDDVLWNQIAAPSLTAIPNAWSDFGRVAGEFLLDRIAGRYSGEPRVKVFPASLIQRESTSERSTPSCRA